MEHKKKPKEEKETPEPQEPETREAIQETDWQAKADEYLDDLKRLKADFENYKKRQTESQKELGGYLIEKLVLDIIPVLDNFNAATQHVPEDQKKSPWIVGIQYIQKQLEDVLKENGVQAIEAGEGEAEENLITKMHQKGYALGERVIRPAKVSVK